MVRNEIKKRAKLKGSRNLKDLKLLPERLTEPVTVPATELNGQ
ncbi:hypothetical protein ACSAZL_11920 [Methanosarcina sp. T3]